MFFRLTADRRRVPLNLIDHFAGPTTTACWIVGGGPSLADAPIDRVTRSLAPTFAVNLAGSHLLRPNFWTAYDPSTRFHRTTYLDAGICKFLPCGRATDLIPETTLKAWDCPNTVFFDLEGRHYENAIASGQTAVLDWADSFTMAIDISYRLGFRKLYLVGCDMRIRVPEAILAHAHEKGLEIPADADLTSLAKSLGEGEVTLQELCPTSDIGCYHFDERKPLAAAVATDRHYFRIAQALRLARRTFSAAGLEIVSATPGSRLNDYFPYESVDSICRSLEASLGSADLESERGRYQLTKPRVPAGIGPMLDMPAPVRDRAARPGIAHEPFVLD